jgi:hypothetical protein
MPPTTASPRRFPAIEGDEAQNLGRQVTRLSPARMIFRQAQGAAPDPGQHPSAPPRQLSPVQLLTWATCLAAAWPRAEDDPYPGLPFRRENVLRACIKIGAHDWSVVAALRMLPQTGLIRFTGPIGRLGPAAAALPNDTWSALRRMHDRLPHAALQQQNTASADITAPDDADATTGARRLPGPLAGPVGISDTLVRAAVTALENAQGPVARSDLGMLADPAIRRATENALAGCGRLSSRLRCWPGRGNWTPGTAPQPAGRSPATTSAPSCGSVATVRAPWSPSSGPGSRRAEDVAAGGLANLDVVGGNAAGR